MNKYLSYTFRIALLLLVLAAMAMAWGNHWVAFAFSVLFPITVYIGWRFYRKAVIYDEIMTFIHDDIATNLMHFEKMRTSVVLSNEPTIQEAHRLMMIMGKRLNEISIRMEEATGLSLRPKPIGPKPVVYN